MPASKKYLNDNVKFPRLPRKYDKRFKLSEKDIKQIIELRQNNTLKFVADKFDIATSTVLYYTNSEYRKRQMTKNAKRHGNYSNERKREIRKIGGAKMREYLSVNMRKQKYAKRNIQSQTIKARAKSR